MRQRVGRRLLRARVPSDVRLRLEQQGSAGDAYGVRTSKLMPFSNVPCLCQGFVLLVHLVDSCFHKH